MMTNPILFWVFALSGLCLVAYYVFVLLASREHSSSGERPASSPSAEREGISVVVVSRNGLESLRALVPSLLAQKYSKFEIVVVNDRSFDNTDVFLKSVQRNYPTVLRIVTVPQDTTYPWPGRKFAITMGVKAAQYERIVLLDNTAVPAGEHWLDALAERMNRPPVEFLIGCTGMREGGLWAALDFRRSACDVAWAGVGSPFRARSSNFALRKSTFLARNGYMKDIRVPAGEADFLLQDAAHRGNTAIVCTADALVRDDTRFSASARREQDIARWAAFRHYRPSAQVKTLLPYLLKAFFLVSALWCGGTMGTYWPYWAGIVLVWGVSSAAGWVEARRLAYPRWMAIGIGIDVLLLPWRLCRVVVAQALLPKGWK